MSRRTKAITGEQLMAKWHIDEYDLSYLILKHELTVLDPPKIPILKTFLRSRHVRTDSEKFLKIIMNDPHSLQQKLFLVEEIENMGDLSSIYIERSKQKMRSFLSSLEDLSSGQPEPRSPEKDDSEQSLPVRYSRKSPASRTRTPSREFNKAFGITDESMLKDAIEDHESEIKSTPNVFSLIGKVWFVKFKNDEWGLYPDQEKYKYIATLLSLSNENPKDKELEYSIYNVDLMVKVKGKKISAEAPNYDEQGDLSRSDLAETFSSEDVGRFRESWHEILEELREARESGDQKLVNETQDKIDRYRSILLNDYGIQTMISKDETRVFFKTLHRASAENEKVRQIVKNQINNAIKDFKEHMPMFGRHLRHSLKTKLYNTLYSPENHILWHVSV
jgi:hypothetical protein